MRILFYGRKSFLLLNAQEPLLASASKASKTKLSKSKKKLESVSPEKTAEFHQRAQEFLDHVAKVIPIFHVSHH